MKIIIRTMNVISLNCSICLKLSGFSAELSNVPKNSIITVDEDSNNILISALPTIKEVETLAETAISKKEILTNLVQHEVENSALYDELSSLRRQISSDEGLPAYIICHDKTLLEMCKVLPLDFDSLLTISGMGSKKIKKYGSKFIEVIKAHIEHSDF